MTFSKDALTGEHILISGGCGALGLAIIKRLVDCGAIVTVNDVLSTEIAYARLAEQNIDTEQITYFQADTTSSVQIKALLNHAEQVFGTVTTGLCHVGMVVSGNILNFDADTFDEVMAVNVRSAFLLAKEIAQRAIDNKKPAHLIFTTSWVAIVPWPEIGPYITSKAAMNQLMRAFARELAPQGIRANAIAPGIVGAGMALRQWNTEPDYRARAEKAIPLGYLQPLESVADTFVFLCSSSASYMTGSIITVDGGASLYPMD